MAGISSKALNSGGNDQSCGCSNKKGFNGNELQNKEFRDGSGLEVYDFNARTYDQQAGRFIQVDPLSEEGDQESLTPYQFSGNNPSTFNDPDGKCPWCIGAIIGAAVEYGTQVATNLASGKSVGESLTNVDGGAILISAGAGALTGGLSAVVPKGAAAKVLVESVKIGVDAVESAGKQYNETGSISLSRTATDVVINKVSGKLTENVNVNSKNTINKTEKQLDRAKRVSEGDPSSSGRSNNVKSLENKLENQKSANAGAQQAAGGVVSSTTQGVVNLPSKEGTPSIPLIKPDNKRASSDNTRLVLNSIRY